MTIEEIIDEAAKQGLTVNVQQSGDIVRVFITDPKNATVTEYTGTASGDPLPEGDLDPVVPEAQEPEAEQPREEAEQPTPEPPAPEV